jgi:hypothetical protein
LGQHGIAGRKGVHPAQSHLARHDDHKAALLEVVRGEGVVVLENLAGEDDLEAPGVVRLSLVGLDCLLQLGDLQWGGGSVREQREGEREGVNRQCNGGPHEECGRGVGTGTGKTGYSEQCLLHKENESEKGRARRRDGKTDRIKKDSFLVDDKGLIAQ